MDTPDTLPVFDALRLGRGLRYGIGVQLAELAVNGLFHLSIARAPRGAHGRPMALAAMFFAIGLAGLLIGVPRSIEDVRQAAAFGRRRRLAQALLGLILNLAAIPVAPLVFHRIAGLKGFILAE